MIQIFKASRPTQCLFDCVPGLLVVLALVLFSGGCSRVYVERADKNANTGNANQSDQGAVTPPPLFQPTITGDIERISYAVSSARDALKQKNWQEALSQLQNGRREVDAALNRQTRMREEFEALKSAMDRAISAVEGRGKEAEARIEELGTRIGAIKINFGGQ